MTVYGSFDLEDDDFFDDTFRNISDTELLNIGSTNVLSESISTNHNGDQSHIETRPPENITVASLSTPGNQSLNPRKSNSFQDHCRAVESNQNFSDKSNFDKELFHTPKTNPVVSIEKTEFINSRFTPGFTSKVKKRKFPGPAGVFSEKDDSNFVCEKSDHIVKKKNEAEIEVQDITNSQFTDDALSLPSWQNLQTDVSSQSSLSTAKYYSIRRVYNETAKKKLPKHIVVPVLCVLLKKFNTSESHSVFIDDTGEIQGKIDKQVLANFVGYLKDGVSLILKKVTFICNVLSLTEESIVSIYLDDGTAKHFQGIGSVPCTEKLLKPMSCQCSATHSMKTLKNQSVLNHSNDSNAVSGNCIHRSANIVPGSYLTPKIPPIIPKNCHFPKLPISLTEKFSKSVPTTSAGVISSKHISVATTSVASVSQVTSNSSVVHTLMTPKQCNSQVMSCSVSETGHVSNNSNQAIVIETSNETNDCFGGNSDFDEFDELLGNLDEKSFLEEF